MNQQKIRPNYIKICQKIYQKKWQKKSRKLKVPQGTSRFGKLFTRF